jgi:WD40 repeat protein
MDSNICLWDAKGVKCKTIAEHSGSVSKLKSENSVVLSSSYDSTVRIYDFNTCESSLGMLKGVHKGPITEFEWNNSLCVTGGRDGLISLWDINNETSIYREKLHNGQVSKIKLHTDEFDKNLIITAGINDGVLNVIDMRSNSKIFSDRIHAGAINFLETNKSNQIITGSADKSIKIIDITSGFREIGTMKSTDSIYCGDINNNFIVVGCADGSLLAYNLDTLECLFGYGCDNKGGLKNVHILEDKRRIVTSGDSGEGMQLLF